MTAILPERFYATTLADMAVGEKAYTAPWAMAVAEDGVCYLNRRYAVEKEPGGTVQMLVERRQDGFWVRLDGLIARWAPSSKAPWAGTGAEDYLPVQGFIT